MGNHAGREVWQEEGVRLVGLVGSPATPWPSPLICYNAAFESLGTDWRCVPLSVRGGGLREALLGLRALGFAGAELAEPYQKEALCYLAEASPAAKRIGAVKFVTVDGHGHLCGDNLQWMAFLSTLRTMVPSLDGLRPLVIGAGDGARGIVYALAREGLPLIIVDEDIGRAIDLVHCLRHTLDEHCFSVHRWPGDLAHLVRHVNLVIATTPIGTWPAVERSPWPDDLPFPTGALVFDMVPWPDETRFLQRAREEGARTASGLSLLAHEAALMFERWTGQCCPLETMLRVMREALPQNAPLEVLTPSDLSLLSPEDWISRWEPSLAKHEHSLVT